MPKIEPGQADRPFNQSSLKEENPSGSRISGTMNNLDSFQTSFEPRDDRGFFEGNETELIEQVEKKHLEYSDTRFTFYCQQFIQRITELSSSKATFEKSIKPF